MVIFVCGVGGVGKTTWLREIYGSPGERWFTASGLLRSECGRFGWQPGDLSFEQSQTYIVKAFEQVSVGAVQNLLIDGHAVVEQGESWARVPIWVFKKLAVARVVLIQDEPEEIAYRRGNDKEKNRVVCGEDRLKELQDTCLIHVAMIGRECGVPVTILGKENWFEIGDIADWP
jgi:adenylate kinase